MASEIKKKQRLGRSIQSGFAWSFQGDGSPLDGSSNELKELNDTNAPIGSEYLDLSTGLRYVKMDTTSSESRGSFKVGAWISNESSGGGSGESNVKFPNTREGDESISIGSGASSNADAENNIAIGEYALGSVWDINGSLNVAIGSFSQQSNLTGSGNTTVGVNALRNSFDMSDNTAIGRASGEGLSAGDMNVFVGAQAGENTQASSSDNCVVVGADASTVGRNPQNQILLGKGAVSEGDNTAVIGNEDTEKVYVRGDLYINESLTRHVEALNQTAGEESYSIGRNNITNADSQNTIAIGEDVLQNSTGVFSSENIAIGSFSQNENQTAGENISIGVNSLRFNVSGGKNTAIGHAAGQEGELGEMNTFIGAQTNDLNQASITGMDNCILIGGEASTIGANPQNQIVIGKGVQAEFDNSVIIGNDDTESTYLKGDVYINDLYPLPNTAPELGSMLVGDGQDGTKWLDPNPSTFISTTGTVLKTTFQTVTWDVDDSIAPTTSEYSFNHSNSVLTFGSGLQGAIYEVTYKVLLDIGSNSGQSWSSQVLDIEKDGAALTDAKARTHIEERDLSRGSSDDGNYTSCFFHITTNTAGTTLRPTPTIYTYDSQGGSAATLTFVTAQRSVFTIKRIK